MNTCYIVCALDCKLDFKREETDLVIGADKGYLTLAENALKPDVAIGDFDTYKGEIVCDKIIKFPPKKDDTDSALAIKYACEQGYKTIVVYGAIGGALDHTLANVSLCAQYAKKGVNVSFIDGNNALFAITNNKAYFSENARGRVSVFSANDRAEGVFERGLLYNIEDYTLTLDIPLGVSNEFVGTCAEIGVENGTLLIYTSLENFKKHLTIK